MNLMETLLDVATNIGWSLLHFLWQGALIYVGYRLLCATLLRKASPGARYGAGVFALLLMALAPVVTYIDLAMQAHGAAANLMSAPATLATSVVGSSQADLATRVGLWLDPLLPWAVGLWMAGVVIHTLRLFSGWRYVNALRRTAAASDLPRELRARFEQLRTQIGISRPVTLARSALVSVPMVIGWLRPVILMPPAALAGLTPYQMELILAHELAHVRRNDYLVNLFQLVLETILFYHPMVGWLSAQVRHERESCCDELVIRSGADAVRYAQALTELELLRSEGMSLAVGATDGILLARVQRLLAPPTPSPLIAVWLSGALVLGATLAGLASMHDVAAQLGGSSTDLPALVRQRLTAEDPTIGAQTTPAKTQVDDPAGETKPPARPAAGATAHDATQTRPAAAPDRQATASAPAHKAQAKSRSDLVPDHAAAGERSPDAARHTPVATKAAKRTPSPAVAKPAAVKPDAVANKPPVAAQKTSGDEQLAGAETSAPAQRQVEPVYTGGTPIHTPKPTYPEVELSRGRAGHAVLSFVVNEHGRVQDVHIVSSAPSSRFGFAARNAIHRWRFKPFEQDGVPVARAVTQQFDFKLPKGSENFGCRTGSHICTSR